MILSALCRYHDVMEERGDVQAEGYSVIPMNYLVCLTPDGKIDDVIDNGELIDKKKSYPTMELPERTQKPGIEANIVEHRPLYLFGLAAENGALVSGNSKAQKSHAAFVDSALDFFADIDSPLAAAYRKFAADWDPSAECENVLLTRIIKDYGTSRFAFCLTGSPGYLLHQDAAVRKKWEREYARRKAEKDRTLGTCAILGEKLPVAVLHDKIKGIRGGQSSGCVLVCVNNDSENSYGKKQASNSSISEKAMKKYTEALNFLLSQREHRTYIDAMTVVHFALEKDEKEMLDYVNLNIFEDNPESDVKASDVDAGLAAAVKEIGAGNKPDFASEKWDAADYCIMGLVPNSSRVAVKFCYLNTFGKFRKNVEKYHSDFAIDDRVKAPPLWKVKSALLSPKSSNGEVPPDIGEKLMRAMLEGAPFPVKILQTIVRRIRTDLFETNSETRIGLLKACLIRLNKNKEEIPTMSLNSENKNAAYLCGRAFAVLEKIQRDSASSNLNKTILDTYFSSACATPASVFPGLFKLSQYHAAKLSKGNAIYCDNLIGEILNDLKEFPKTLTLDDQGNFILGYYQQKRAFYVKNNQSEEN